MRTTIRPFTKVIRFAGNNSVSGKQQVDLVDSANVGLKCNYIYVEASSASFDHFAVELPLAGRGDISGLGAYLTSGSGKDIEAGSGLLGGVAPLTKGVVELSLHPQEAVSSINIWNNDFTTVSEFYVTYGVMQEINSLADRLDIPRGT
jgi:hypothetical protein